MKLVIKIASRERPELLTQTIAAFSNLCSDRESTSILVSADVDDVTMRDFEPKSDIVMGVLYGKSESKIDAVNRDVMNYEWDLCMFAADDCVPVSPGYDDTIRQTVEKLFPDLDGVLWCPDGQQDRIPTHPILGRKWYDRRGYCWEPRFKSLYCDDWLRLSAKKEHKLHKVYEPRFTHLHPKFKGGRKRDMLDGRNQKWAAKDLNLFQNLSNGRIK